VWSKQRKTWSGYGAPVSMPMPIGMNQPSPDIDSGRHDSVYAALAAHGKILHEQLLAPDQLQALAQNNAQV